MKICIIGYKNHSKRLEKILYSLGYKDIFLFNHNMHTFKDIKEYDVFFISSPNSTHMQWIQELNTLDKYIFCEKPPVTTLEDLEKITPYNPKLYFNFNYRFTKLATVVKEYIQTNKLGKPIYMNCISSTGLAFKEAFKNDWRFIGDDIFSSIIGNVGIHYIDMIGYIFGGIDNMNIDNVHITSKKLPDTSKISINSGNVYGDIFISYAAPFHNEVKVIFDNGSIHLQNGVLSLATPRDTFDSNERFISPNNKVIYECSNSREYFDTSLEASIKFFLQHVKNNSNIPLEFHTQSINTTQLILNEINYD